MNDVVRRLADNLAQVRSRMAAASQRGGRARDTVRLVAITKSMPAELAAALFDLGCTSLGESRPQELWAKADALAPRAVEWHLIGHLQRNKIRRTLPLLGLLQSVDSARLLQALNDEAAALSRRQDVLLEVNVSGDASKTGIAPEELEPLIASAAGLPHVAVRGLMAMASGEGGPTAARRDFARLRQLRDRAAASAPPGVTLDELSMGMSGDFEIAIEEGATMVRVGSALFEGIEA